MSRTTPPLRLVWNLFADNDETGSGDAPAFSDHDYYVTITPGRFVNVRCDDAQFEEQEMYPIGIVVKPVAYVSLPDFENAHGDKAILVVTEYGHRKIIREQDIQPIVHNAVYIFSDSPMNSRICRSKDDCPGNEVSTCERPAKCRYEISARYGYAIAAAGDPAVRQTVAAYNLLIARSARDPDFWLTEEEKKEHLANGETACRPFPVKAYKAGAILQQPRDSYLSLCATRKAAGAKDNAVFPLKMVTRSYAERAFSWHLDGSFHRRFAEAGQEPSELLAALSNYQITSVKECGTEIKSSAGFDASAGLKANFSAGVVEISAGAGAKLETSISRTLSKDDYLKMSTYIIEPIANAPRVNSEDDNDLWFFRVIFRSKCVDGTPSSATSIIIHYHRLAGGLLEVRANDDLRKSYLEDWADYSYSPDNSASSLREGQFWTVPDLQGYFIWRDTLRSFIEVDNIVTSNLLAKHPDDQQPYVRDFFVYLMLAAAYHHRDPSIRGG